MAKPQYWLNQERALHLSLRAVGEGRRDGVGRGVRSFEARNNIRAMKPGDLCLYYHSNEGKAVVGVARVLGEPGEDPTAPGEDWASVEVGPLVALKERVTLATIKASSGLKDFVLIKKSRLSVAPTTAEHFKRILEMGGTKLPRGR